MVIGLGVIHKLRNANFTHLEVCIPGHFFSRQDKTRLEGTSQIAEIVKRLLMSGFVAWENSGKIRDGTGLLSTTQEILEWS